MFWTPVISVSGSLIVALLVTWLGRLTEKGRWLREERMTVYSDYLKSAELYRSSGGEAIDGLNTLIAEVENRTRLDILGPKKVRAATVRLQFALAPIRERHTFTKDEYGEYLNAKTALVTAQLKALGIRGSDPDPFSSERIADWWDREYK